VDRLKAEATTGEVIGSHAGLVRLQRKRSTDPVRQLGATLTTAVTDSARLTSADSDDASGMVKTSGAVHDEASTADRGRRARRVTKGAKAPFTCLVQDGLLATYQCSCRLWRCPTCARSGSCAAARWHSRR